MGENSITKKTEIVLEKLSCSDENLELNINAPIVVCRKSDDSDDDECVAGFGRGVLARAVDKNTFRFLDGVDQISRYTFREARSIDAHISEAIASASEVNDEIGFDQDIEIDKR